MDSFDKTLLELSDELLGDQLDKMKFLCVGLIGKGALEKINTGYNLFQALKERKKLASDNTDFLSSLLTNVGREDLSEKLTNFTRKYDASFGEDEQSKAERDKLDLAADIIAQNLGKTWRKLGRKLGVNETKLESIAEMRLDLEGKALKLLMEWMKAQGKDARANKLLEALRECDQNLTAEKVEEKLNMGKGH